MPSVWTASSSASTARPWNTERVAPYECVFDTTVMANGPHTLQARVYDAAGNSSVASVSVQVANA